MIGFNYSQQMENKVGNAVFKAHNTKVKQKKPIQLFYICVLLCGSFITHPTLPLSILSVS